MSITLLYLISYLLGGHITLHDMQNQVVKQEIPQYAIQVQIGPEIAYNNFGASFLVNSYIMALPETPYTQAPFQTIYTTNLFYRANTFEVGYEHQCVHPTLSATKRQEVLRYGGYDKLYIKGKITLKGGTQ